MSDSGSVPPPPPPPGPQGQPGGWSAAPPPPPPGGAYGAPPPPAPGQWSQPAPTAANFGGRRLAEWPKRVVGNLIDYSGPAILAGIVQAVLDSFFLGMLVWLAALGWGLYNAYLQGETGQSTGKKMQNMRLLSEETGQYIGGGMGIARFFLHIVDAIPCYIGFLFPIWDAKKQTFADKILKTVVVDES